METQVRAAVAQELEVSQEESSPEVDAPVTMPKEEITLTIGDISKEFLIVVNSD